MRGEERKVRKDGRKDWKLRKWSKREGGEGM